MLVSRNKLREENRNNKKLLMKAKMLMAIKVHRKVSVSGPESLQILIARSQESEAEVVAVDMEMTDSTVVATDLQRI